MDFKTGSWVKINEKRVFLTRIGNTDIEGLEFDGYRVRSATYSYGDISSINASKAPFKLDHPMPKNIPFGICKWDIAKKRVHSISYVIEGKLQNIAI